ncbi:MAG: hypothetical protein Q8O14_00325 [bacterium]|nr:hypothetical protein [bacterium]
MKHVPRQIKKRIQCAAKRPRGRRNVDPHWTNWEVLAAFGEDEHGGSYLDAVKRFCCMPHEEDVWLDNLVRQARQAHDRAGQSRAGREAAWEVLCQAGMVLLHDLMNELQVQVERKRKPRAAFYWPAMAVTVIINTNWRVSIVPD